MGWRDGPAVMALQNPLSRERSVLRPSLVPGLLEVLATNVHRAGPDAAGFEAGHASAPHRDEDADRPAHEELWVAIALTGLRQPRAWHAGRERADVYDAKGMAELVLAAAGAGGWETSPFTGAAAPRYIEQGRGAALMVGGAVGGWVREVGR